MCCRLNVWMRHLLFDILDARGGDGGSPRNLFKCSETSACVQTVPDSGKSEYIQAPLPVIFPQTHATKHVQYDDSRGSSRRRSWQTASGPPERIQQTTEPCADDRHDYDPGR